MAAPTASANTAILGTVGRRARSMAGPLRTCHGHVLAFRLTVFTMAAWHMAACLQSPTSVDVDGLLDVRSVGISTPRQGAFDTPTGPWFIAASNLDDPCDQYQLGIVPDPPYQLLSLVVSQVSSSGFDVDLPSDSGNLSYFQGDDCSSAIQIDDWEGTASVDLDSPVLVGARVAIDATSVTEAREVHHEFVISHTCETLFQRRAPCSE